VDSGAVHDNSILQAHANVVTASSGGGTSTVALNIASVRTTTRPTLIMEITHDFDQVVTFVEAVLQFTGISGYASCRTSIRIGGAVIGGFKLTASAGTITSIGRITCHGFKG
jgi:hypothetical protein